MDIDLDMDFEILPQLTPQEQREIELEHEERLRKFYQSTHQYSLEHWYKQLSEFTFSSTSFPLTNIQAYLLTLIYHDDRDLLNLPEIIKARSTLIKKVNSFIETSFPKGCFMKLSTRSPKDAGWRYKNEEVVNSHVQKLANRLRDVTKLDKKATNMIYRYFLEESKDKLKVCSGQDFISIFSQSQRIQIDINDLALLNNHAFQKLANLDYSTAQEQLIAVWGRQWIDCQWMEEFRCFFHDHQLTAICQYDQRCFFPQLMGKEQSLMKRITSFFEAILPKLEQIKMSEGVMDLIVKKDQNQPIILIQINIFNHNSRASLFNWQKDLQLLQKGPKQLRLLTSEIEISKYELAKMMGMVQKGIEVILNGVMKKLSLEKEWENLD